MIIKKFISPLNGIFIFFATNLIINTVYSEENIKKNMVQKYKNENEDNELVDVFNLTNNFEDYNSSEYIYNLILNNYKKNKYKAVKNLLSIAISSKRQNDKYTPYLYFYSFLCSYKSKDLESAIYILKYLYKKYSNWEQINEVLYWLIRINFENRKYIDAFKYANKVKNKYYKSLIKKMKIYFLDKIDDRKIFKNLLKVFNEKKLVRKSIEKKISCDPLIDINKNWVKELIEEHDLKIQINKKVNKLKSIKKSSYNIAVLLPFIIEEQSRDNQENSFVFDLYRGIYLCVETLKEEGIDINLKAYDTKNNVEITKHLLNKYELKKMDLIIGPLFPDTVDLVANFAKTYKINMVNPLSMNSSIIHDNIFTYLFMPSIETQAKKAADYTVSCSGVKKIGIIYSNKLEDRVNAMTYKKYVEKYLNKEVSLIVELSEQESQAFLKKFRNKKVTSKMSEQEILKYEQEKTIFDEITHLYVASYDKLIVGNILAIIEMRKLHPEIIGHQKWLQHNTVSFDTIQRLNVNMISPSYINFNKKNYNKYRLKYLEKYSKMPNFFSNVGYELMYFFGQSLNDYGTYFQKDWTDMKEYKGKIYKKLSYGRFQNNQNVDVLYFNKGKLVTRDVKSYIEPY